MTLAYWWDTHPNWGDELTAELLLHYGFGVGHAEPEDADFVGVGSVLELFDGFTGTVWGTGRAGVSAPDTDLGGAHVLALRGPMTMNYVTGVPDDVLLGDPGLLVSDLVERDRRHGPLHVNHWQDKGAVNASPMFMLTAIAQAEDVTSSSLHGLIAADSLGIPRLWVDTPNTNWFKFQDYAASIDAPTTPGVWWRAPDLTEKKNALREALLAYRS